MAPWAQRTQTHGTRMRWGPRLTPCVLTLLLINGGVFLAEFLLLPYFLNLGWGVPLREVAPRLESLFGLDRQLLFRGFVWQPVTYLFLHASGMHLLGNLLALWIFGSDVEAAWGWKAFLRFYLVCGIGAGLVQAALFPGATVGASGSIYGILVAYAVLYPNRRLWIWGIAPVPARVLVIAWIVLEVVFLWRNDGVAHLAHLGGAAVGWLYIQRAWRIGPFLRDLRWKLRRRRFRVSNQEDDPRFWN